MDKNGSDLTRKKKSGTLDWFVNAKKTKTQENSSFSPPIDRSQLPYVEEEIQFDVNSISHDPGTRKNIYDYHPNVQDMVRREYIQRGPCQPRAHDFPQTNFGDKLPRFNSIWFEKYNWLEYSVEKDAAFCFVCYLFNNKDAFIRNGFKGWNRPVAFGKHIGKVNSLHNQAREKFEALTRPQTSIRNVLDHQSSEAKKRYRDRLLYSLYCLKFLLHQGLAFRGHNEKKESSNRGNFLELLEWLAKHNEIVREVLQKAPKNHKMIAPSIQKDLINSCAKEINGLKTLLMQDTPSSYYVHCFAHQLQLTLVAVSKKSTDCHWLFEQLTSLLNVIGVSCKRKEMLREAQAQHVLQALDDGELESGKGKNQKLGLVRPGDTRWGSYYKLLANVVDLYPVICKVLDNIGENSSVGEDKAKEDAASYAIESFDFIFMVHLMKRIFGVANDLNVALQKKDQDIINAISLVKSTKKQLQKIRVNGKPCYTRSLVFVKKLTLKFLVWKVSMFPEEEKSVANYTP